MNQTLDGIEEPAVEKRIEVRVVNATDPDILSLVDALDAEIEERYPNHRIVGLPAATDGLLLAVAYLDSKPVGCGALRELGPDAGEIKRMFVVPDARRLGVAHHILGSLETVARSRGYSLLRLETGVRQPEALALYEAWGFHRIPAFGEYVDGGLSVCLEKQLG